MARRNSTRAFGGNSRETRREVALRARSFMCFALGEDRRPQTAAEIVGKFVQVGVSINLDGHLRRIANDVAVVAPLKVVFQFRPGLGVHRVIKVIG